MIEGLPQIILPEWLSVVDADSIETSSFPLEEVLRNSLYYPSSGFDGDPVRYMAGNILTSFM